MTSNIEFMTIFSVLDSMLLAMIKNDFDFYIPERKIRKPLKSHNESVECSPYIIYNTRGLQL